MSVFQPGDHGSTFGGNPLAAAIGIAALDVILEEELPEKALQLGEYFLRKLQSIESSYIKEVRGKGLLIGMELHPEAAGARRFCKALAKEGLLAKETRDNVIRFAPPLVISQDEIDWALEKIERVLTTTC
jgi:ornithine--oxo-acid transaminase